MHLVGLYYDARPWERKSCGTVLKCTTYSVLLQIYLLTSTSFCENHEVSSHFSHTVSSFQHSLLNATYTAGAGALFHLNNHCRPVSSCLDKKVVSLMGQRCPTDLPKVIKNKHLEQGVHTTHNFFCVQIIWNPFRKQI